MLPAPDGQGKNIRWSLITKVPLRNAAGEIVGIVNVSRDISERKRIEREREMEHAIARALAESRSVGETMLRLLQIICEAMQWAYGARWLWDGASSNLKRAEWWSDSPLEFAESDRLCWTELVPQETGGLVRKALDRPASGMAHRHCGKGYVQAQAELREARFPERLCVSDSRARRAHRRHGVFRTRGARAR